MSRHLNGTALGVKDALWNKRKKTTLKFPLQELCWHSDTEFNSCQSTARMDKVDEYWNLKKIGQRFQVWTRYVPKILMFSCRDGVASKRFSDIAFLVYKECCMLRINYVRSFVFSQFNLEWRTTPLTSKKSTPLLSAVFVLFMFESLIFSLYFREKDCRFKRTGEWKKFNYTTQQWKANAELLLQFW